jgi:predicted site-specific integrase-resolvase
MGIGELAQQIGVSTDTVRFYEPGGVVHAVGEQGGRSRRDNAPVTLAGDRALLAMRP